MEHHVLPRFRRPRIPFNHFKSVEDGWVVVFMSSGPQISSTTRKGAVRMRLELSLWIRMDVGRTAIFNAQHMTSEMVDALGEWVEL